MTVVFFGGVVFEKGARECREKEDRGVSLGRSSSGCARFANGGEGLNSVSLA